MEGPIPALPFAATMFLGMMICLEIGRFIGKRHLLRDPKLMSTHSSVDGSVFALYGLLLAFTFSGAPTRLDARRKLIGDEVNAITDAYLRIDLMATDQQPQLREAFRKYLDVRITAYQKSHDLTTAEHELVLVKQAQKELWKTTIAATSSVSGHPEGGKLLLPAVNQMIDVANNRMMAMRTHPPAAIFALLFLMAQVCSLMAGYAMATSSERSWLHIVAFALIAVVTVFMVLEIEYPRLGFVVNLRDYDQALVDLRQSMQ
jgi:hypothetical protein